MSSIMLNMPLCVRIHSGKQTIAIVWVQGKRRAQDTENREGHPVSLGGIRSFPEEVIPEGSLEKEFSLRSGHLRWLE